MARYLPFTAASSSRVGGTAPLREAVREAAVDAYAPRLCRWVREISLRLSRWAAPSSEIRVSPSMSAAKNESPAPAVSITSTCWDGMRMGLPERG